MDLDASLWEHDTNQDEHIDAGEGVVIEGDLGVEVKWNQLVYV
jgi:hypothetical protein